MTREDIQVLKDAARMLRTASRKLDCIAEGMSQENVKRLCSEAHANIIAAQVRIPQK